MTEPSPLSLVERVLRLDELADVAVPLSLRAADDLRIADLLADGPLGLGELAARTGSDARSLGRVLRALAGRGVFRVVEPERFALTPLAEQLRTDHPRSMAGAFPLLPADVRAWARIGLLLEDPQRGAAGLERLMGGAGRDVSGSPSPGS